MNRLGVDPSPCTSKDHQSKQQNSGLNLSTYNHRYREAGVELDDTLKRLDLLVTQADRQSLDVSEELFNLPPTNDREDVGRLVHEVRDSD